MYELIFLIILVGSLGGIILIIIRKIPILAELPVQKTTEAGFFFKLKAKIKDIRFIKNFSFERILQKILLKTEKKTNGWLMKLRERSAAQKSYTSDDYWQELKKSFRISSGLQKQGCRTVKVKESPSDKKISKPKTRKPRARRRKNRPV